MQKIWLLICTIGMLLLPLSVLAETGGTVTLELAQDDPEKLPNYETILNSFMREADIFDKKYPGAALEEDFADDVLELHPEYKTEDAISRQKLLRRVISFRRIYHDMEKKFKEFLLSNDIPEIRNFAQESAPVEKYIETSEPLVVTKFEKTSAPKTSIGSDSEISEAQKRAELKKAFLEWDWKKIFSYGLFDGKPLDDQRGIGEYVGNDKLRVRLLLSQRTIADKKISGAVQILVFDKYFLLRNAYQDYQALQLTFKNSGNLAGIQTNWPLPRRFPTDLQHGLVGYVGSVIIPFELEVKDVKQPLHLKAGLNAEVCGDNQCERVNLLPELTIEPGEPEAATVADYLRQAEIYAPKESHPKIKLTKLMVETSANPQDAQVVRLEIESGKSPKTLDIFLERPGVKFANPLIRIDGSKIVARFKALNKPKSLIGKKFTVSVKTNPDASVRQSMIAESASLFDNEGSKISLSLIWLGFIGGFLLNLMPCVFPVLSLKLLSFTKFGGLAMSKIRQGFIYNLWGILTSFAVIIAGLVALKLLGRSVGWGMQFQNVYFLCLIIFAVTAFLAHVWGIINFRTPKFVEKTLQSQQNNEKMLHFLTGIFLVLLSTPCTAPYLGTALGFALAGSVADIIIMVSAVGVGLALPYILFAVFPAMAFYMPSPGRWMSRLESIMALMLVLTLVWLLSILYAQTGGALIFHFVLYLSGFLFILWFRKNLFEVIDRLDEAAELLAKTRTIFNIISMTMLAILMGAALYDAGTSYRYKRHTETDVLSQQMLREDEIKNYLRQGRIVMVRVGADWCLTCKYNDFTVFKTAQIQELLEEYNIISIDIDWTNYNPEVLAFMEKFGRRGLPFYIIFSPRVPEGMVLPEIVTDREFRDLIENLRY